MSSNIVLKPEILDFVRRSLKSVGYSGYYELDWAGRAASGRSFYRVFAGRTSTYILMKWSYGDDWRRFFYLHDIPGIEELTPKVYMVDSSAGFIFLEDGGARQLKDILFTGIDKKSKISLMEGVLQRLYSWHNLSIPTSIDSKLPRMDRDHLLWESSYFKEGLCYLNPKLADLFDENWNSIRAALAEGLFAQKQGLMHRDFQSENILLLDGAVSFVDIQGARIGPASYDIASLIFDPYIAQIFDGEERSSLIAYASNLFSITPEDILLASLQRLMQATGAYGYLTVKRGLTRYRRYAESSLRFLEENASILRAPILPDIAQTARLSLFKK